MKNSPEKAGGKDGLVEDEEKSADFSALSSLVAEVKDKLAEDQKAAEQANEKAQLEEGTAEAEKAQHLKESQAVLLNEQIESENDNRLKTAEREYYLLAADEKGLNKVGSTHQTPESYRNVGYVTLSSPWEMKKRIIGPQDYIDTFDSATDWHDEHIAEQIAEHGDYGDEAGLDKIIEDRQQAMIDNDEPGYLIGNNKSGDEWEHYKGKDMDPEVFSRFVKEHRPGYAGLLYEHRQSKEKDRQMLGRFSEVALENDNVEIALEGFSRLGELDKKELIEVIKQTVETLIKSDDEKDQFRLKNLLERVEQLTS